jgi:hypothetical protein
VKTISLKKVSAVAVASLGFGLLSVVPAQAATTNATGTISITAPAVSTNGDFDTPIPQGTAITADLLLLTAANIDIGVITNTYQILDPNGTDITAAATFSTAAAAAITNATVANATTNVITVTVAGAAANYTTSAKKIGAVTIPATSVNVPGIYQIKNVITMDAANSGAPTAAQDGTTSVARGQIYVSGSGVTQGLTRSTDGTAVVNGAATVKFFAPVHSSGDTYRIYTSGVGSISGVTASVGTASAVSGVASDLSKGVNWLTASANSDNLTLNLSSSVAGAQTITAYSVNASTGVSTLVATSVVTWGAATVVGAVSAANSTAFMTTDAATPFVTVTADDLVTAARTANGRVGTIKVNLKDTQATPVANVGYTVSATVSGSGLIGSSTGTGTDNAYTDGTVTGTLGRVTSAVTDALGNMYIGLFGDGTSGVATVTISATHPVTAVATVIATKTFTFYGAVASYTVTPQYIAAANGVQSTNAVLVCAKDAAGINVPNSQFYAYSGNTAVATVETTVTTRTTAVAAKTGTSFADHVPVTAVGCDGVNLTGASQTTTSSVEISIGNAATLATSTITAKATVALGAVSAASVAFKTDKATYTPGEAIVMSLTFKDADGRLVAYGPGTATLAAALTASASFTSALFGTANITTNGVTTQTVYAPLTSGRVLIAGTTGAAGGTYLDAAASAVALNGSITVTPSTDISAITTSISALNAKIVALNALIAKIMKRLNIR